MDKLALFMFLSAGAVSLFTFLTVSHWISTTSAERRHRERLAILRKMADQPATLDTMRALLRDEDAREEARARERGRHARRESLQSGATIFAVGVGLSTFLYFIVPEKPIWTVGSILVFVGAIIAAFAYAGPVDASAVGESEAD